MKDDRRKRIQKFIVYHTAAFTVLFILFKFYKCPIHYFFHIPCPGCGITRANIAALHLNFKKAFEYHPLFFTAAPLVLYTSYRNMLKKRLSGKAESIILIILAVSFIGVYIFRILNNTLNI